MENNNENLKNSNSENSSFFEQKVSSSNGNEGYPNLRFKEFQTEWIDATLNSITLLIKDGTHGSYNDVKVGIPLLSAKDIESGKILIPQDCRRISIEDYNSIFKNYNLKINDILLTIVGTIGRVAMVDNLTNKYALQRSVAIIRVNSLNHPLFIFYLLQTNNIKKQYYSKMNQSAQGGIYLDSLNKLSFKNTILSEQEKIAKFLSIVDKRIEKQRQLVESLKKYKRGLLSAIFEQKHRFKDENGNDYPEWIYTTIKSALNYEQPQKYIVKTENYNDNYDTPVLTANKAFVLGYTDEKDGIYNKGNVIIYDDFTMDFKFVEFNFKVKSSTIKMLTAKENYNLYFIFNLLTHLNLKPQGHQRSYISILEPMEFLCPTFKEQNKIASFLYDIDKKIEQQFKYLNKLEFTKKGLLQQMFI